MLISKKVLAVHRFALDDQSRSTLNSIQLLPDGSAVATNGGCLVKVTPKEKSAVGDFPTTQGEHTVLKEELMIPLDTCKAAEKSISKQASKKFPILGNVALTDTDSTNKMIESTDLDSWTRLEFQPTTGSFPNWKQVIPGEKDVRDFEKNKNTFDKFKEDARAGKNGYKEYGISAKILKAIAEFKLEDKCAGNPMISMFISDDAGKSIGFTWTDSDENKIDGVLMPMRIKD